MISTLGPLQSSYWGSSNSKLLSAHSHERHTSPPPPPPPPQYSACFCLGHWHPKMFPLCYCEGNKTTSGTVTERVGGPRGSISLSLLLQAVQLWLQLACAVHLYTVSVVPWPPILRWCFKERLLWCKHRIGSFIHPSLAPYQSFPSSISRAALCLTLSPAVLSILYRLVLCVPPHVT